MNHTQILQILHHFFKSCKYSTGKMKTQHLPIMIIVSVLVIVASSDLVYAQLPSGNLALRLISISKSNFADGEIIPIRGYTLPNSTVNISLSDNLGNLENSTQLNSNDTGYFYTNLGIPSHVIGGGSWHIFAKSHNNYESIRIQVNTHGVVTMPDNFPSGLSPLKQFKLGIPTDAIQCHTSFQLVLKAEDKFPACVKSDTAQVLIKREWAVEDFAHTGLGVPTKTSIFDTGITPMSANVTNTNFIINYNIIGGNVSEITQVPKSNTLIVLFQTTGDGRLTLEIPRALLDSKSEYSNQDTKFIILVDKQEVKYTETTSIDTRTLTIPFELGAKKIEITAPVNV